MDFGPVGLAILLNYVVVPIAVVGLLAYAVISSKKTKDGKKAVNSLGFYALIGLALFLVFVTYILPWFTK